MKYENFTLCPLHAAWDNKRGHEGFSEALLLSQDFVYGWTRSSLGHIFKLGEKHRFLFKSFAILLFTTKRPTEMAILPILTAPDPRLKKKCQPVDTVDDDIRQLMDDMLETMYAAPGIGLAAPQIGVSKRIIVVDVAKEGQEAHPLCLANPEIIESAENSRIYEEGCLSLPDYYAEVERPDWVRVRYLDQQNKVTEVLADDLLATCIQHEMDHLEGVLFVDHLSKLKRDVILRKLQKLKRTQTS